MLVLSVRVEGLREWLFHDLELVAVICAQSRLPTRHSALFSHYLVQTPRMTRDFERRVRACAGTSRGTAASFALPGQARTRAASGSSAFSRPGAQSFQASALALDVLRVPPPIPSKSGVARRGAAFPEAPLPPSRISPCNLLSDNDFGTPFRAPDDLLPGDDDPVAFCGRFAAVEHRKHVVASLP